MKIPMLAVLPALLVLSGPTDPGPRSAPAEVVRIRGHLERVARELRADPPLHLTPAQREARELVLGWLDEYRAAGRFPHNHVWAGGRVPVFVDPHGTPCAVGYLMLRSGADELVAEIARDHVLVRVPELADDARVRAWLDAHGLTLEEAARIQPSYDHRDARVNAGYVEAATLGLSLTTLSLATWGTTAGPHRGAPWVDRLSVGASMTHAALLAILAASDRDDPGWMVGMNLAGLLAGAGSAIFRAHRRAETPAPGEQASVRAFLSPTADGLRVGLAVRH